MTEHKISIIYPAYHRAELFPPSAERWMAQTRLPDEIIILENYHVNPPSFIDTSNINIPSGVVARHFRCDTTLRRLWLNRDNAVRDNLLKFNGLFNQEQIKAAWDFDGRLIRSGTWVKNVGARLATGDIIIICDAEVYPLYDGLIQAIETVLDSKNVALFAYIIRGYPYGRTKKPGMENSIMFKNKAFGFTFAMRKETYINVGGLDEMFDAQWGFDDEALSEFVLPRNGIRVVHPKWYRMYHQWHDDRVYVNHNAEATAYYRKLPKGLWKANESRGWMNWGEPRGWVEVGKTS